MCSPWRSVTDELATEGHGRNTEKDRRMQMELLHKELTEQIIGAAFEVYRHLGYGFLEKVYQRAMKVELESRGFRVEIESKIKVLYKGIVVGDYQADLFV